jgi:hypothetical protein
MSLLTRLRAMVDALPEGASLLLPGDWLRDELTGIRGSEHSHAPELPTDERPAVLTVAEVATRYSRSPSTVRGWCENGALPGSFRLGGSGSWRVPEAALAAFEKHSERCTRERAPALALHEGQSIGDWQRRRRASGWKHAD